MENIYDEELSPDKNTLFTTSKAVSPSTEPIAFSRPSSRVWSAPILSREKLIETLNALEQEHYQIFTVLTVSASVVQIVCFQEKTQE